MASWASSRSANRASSRAEAERSPGSVSWQSRLDDSARNSADGSTDRGDRRSDASRDDDSASRRYGETQDEGSVSKAARPLGFTTRRFTTGSDLRDRKHVGRTPRTSASKNSPPANAVTVSKNFVVFVCAGLAFFGLSVLGAGRSNRAFERHFQEIAKVRADRRRLREENEALARENARLRLEASGERGGGYDAAYHAPERLVQEVSAIDGSIGGSIGGSIVYGFRG